MEAYIKLKKDEDILTFKIQDENGNDTGEKLEFDLRDLELPYRYEEMVKRDNKAREKLQADLLVIKKKKDVKGKKLFSANEEATIKAVKDFYKEEEQIYDMFLGEGGVKKLLNGRAFGITTLSEIDEIIETYIRPKLEANAKDITEEIKKKYSDKKDDVIE